MKNRYVILTGVPRSGTTLACYLLNKLPNTVALNEPMPVAQFAALPNHKMICIEIRRFFEQTRKSLIEDGTAISKHVGGVVPDNPFGEERRSMFDLRYAFKGRKRRIQASNGRITIEKPLSRDLLLCIKHPAAFTAILGNLVHHFPCYAVVRNPLAVLSSWNSCEMPAGDGRAPAAELLDQALAQNLSKIRYLFDRQLYLLSWYFEQYRDHLPSERILRYEDIVDSGGSALRIITPQAMDLNVVLENKNQNRLYDRKLMRRLGEKLLKMDGAFLAFYTKEEIEELLEDVFE